MKWHVHYEFQHTEDTFKVFQLLIFNCFKFILFYFFILFIIYKNFKILLKKEKCIIAYDIKKRKEFGKPITLEEKDKIYGYDNIVFEEFLFSILDIPNLMIMPFKFAAWVCNHMDFSPPECAVLVKPHHKYCPLLSFEINREFQLRL